MRKNDFHPYIAAGLTAFAVLAGGILLFFAVFHWGAVLKFLNLLSYTLRPVFYGMVLAFLLLPIQRGFNHLLTGCVVGKRTPGEQEQKLLRFLSTILSLTLAALIVYLLLSLVLPEVYRSIKGLVQACPDYFEKLQTLLAGFFENNPDIQALVLSYYDRAETYFESWFNAELLPNFESLGSTLSWLRQSILPNVTGVMSNVSAVLFGTLYLLKDLLVAVIVSIYLLMRKDVFAAQSKKLVYSIFPLRWAEGIVEETRRAYHILSGFINGKLLDSLIIGLIALVCCNLFGFPYPALVATIIGVTNIIPFFGPFIGAIPCAMLIFLVSPKQCLYFIIFVFILQQFDGNILGPKILGDSTGLASFWVLFSILLFGGLFGFAGMVLGVPVFAMIYSAVSRLAARSLKKRGLPTATEEYMTQTLPQPCGETKE